VVALSLTLRVADAQVTEPVYIPPDPSYGDPFCAVAVTAVSAHPLILQLHAAGASVSARIVVFTSTGAYAATTPSLTLLGDKPVKTTAAFEIVPAKPVPTVRKQAAKMAQPLRTTAIPAPSDQPSVSDPIDPRYMYVDAYSIDGAPEKGCSTEPVAFLNAGGAATTPASAPNGSLPVSAANSASSPAPANDAMLGGSSDAIPPASLLQYPITSADPLPQLPCGVERTQTTVKMAVSPASVDRNLGHGSAHVLVYVNARGELARTVMFRSSTSDIDDKATLSAAAQSRYVAGTFYCIPVDGVYLFEAIFERYR
jgi:hypothetical protein